MNKIKNPAVIAYCDFGTSFRKTEIQRHKSVATGMRQYARLWDIYTKIHGWKVWQEYIKK